MRRNSQLFVNVGFRLACPFTIWCDWCFFGVLVAAHMCPDMIHLFEVAAFLAMTFFSRVVKKFSATHATDFDRHFLFKFVRNLLASMNVNEIMHLMFGRKLLLIALISVSRLDADLFEDGDMVILLGNTVIERAHNYGHFETGLTLAADKKNLRFRNLGWSGDTVFGHARSYFGPPQEGFNRLEADLGKLKPNVVIVCYGAVAAFEGDEGMAEFLASYDRLLKMIKKASNPRAVILVSPPPAETLDAPMPDMKEHNKRLSLYAKAIADLARKNQHTYADFFTIVGDGVKGQTSNGLHFSERGYCYVGPKFVKALGLSPVPNHQLESESGIQLRKNIIAKNKLFFQQWRPANETYLRLFRKHEQGQNVKELPMFDPLIAEREKQIEILKQSTLATK